MTTTLARLVTLEAKAKAIADALAECFELEDLAASAFEIPQDNALPSAVPRPSRAREGALGTLLPDAEAPWLCELHFATRPDEAAIRALVRSIAGDEAATALTFEVVAAQDWIATALEGLTPVNCGRFTVHGAHSRGDVKRNRLNIEIEAALAFGTGHHGTTRGCLLHFDAVLKRRRPHEVVDIGSGSGVLAFAAAKALKAFIHAGELDPDSVRVARGSARRNGVANFVRPLPAAGLRHPGLRAWRRYDLVFANILARPLRALAPEIAQGCARGGELILSGLLLADVAGVLAKYRSFGFHLVARREIEGWASLLLRRGGGKPRRLA